MQADKTSSTGVGRMPQVFKGVDRRADSTPSGALTR